MNQALVAVLIGCVSLLYATAGQAGGTTFLAVMAFAALPATEMRATALLLNIVAAGYATRRLHRRGMIDRQMLLLLTVPSVVTAFFGGLLVLSGRIYFIATGLLLVATAVLMVFKRTADTVKARPVPPLAAALVGTGTGFVSGLTGVGAACFYHRCSLPSNGHLPGERRLFRRHSSSATPWLDLPVSCLPGRRLPRARLPMPLLFSLEPSSDHYRPALDVRAHYALRSCCASSIRRE
jgi:hypothetical protein